MEMTVAKMRRGYVRETVGGGCAQCNGEKKGVGRRVSEGAAFGKRRMTYLTLQPCQREQNTEESRG